MEHHPRVELRVETRFISAIIHRLLLDPHFSWTRTTNRLDFSKVVNTYYILKTRDKEILRIKITHVGIKPYPAVIATMVVNIGCDHFSSTTVEAAVNKVISAYHDYGFPAGTCQHIINDELHRALSTGVFYIG